MSPEDVSVAYVYVDVANMVLSFRGHVSQLYTGLSADILQVNYVGLKDALAVELGRLFGRTTEVRSLELFVGEEDLARSYIPIEQIEFEGVKLVEGYLTQKAGCARCGYQDDAQREKCVDTQIAVHMMRDLLSPRGADSRIDVQVLLSGDADFLPVFAAIRDFRKDAVVVYWGEQSVSQDVRALSSWPNIWKIDLENLRRKFVQSYRVYNLNRNQTFLLPQEFDLYVMVRSYLIGLRDRTGDKLDDLSNVADHVMANGNPYSTKEQLVRAIRVLGERLLFVFYDDDRPSLGLGGR